MRNQQEKLKKQRTRKTGGILNPEPNQSVSFVCYSSDFTGQGLLYQFCLWLCLGSWRHSALFSFQVLKSSLVPCSLWSYSCWPSTFQIPPLAASLHSCLSYSTPAPLSSLLPHLPSAHCWFSNISDPDLSPLFIIHPTWIFHGLPTWHAKWNYLFFLSPISVYCSSFVSHRKLQYGGHFLFERVKQWTFDTEPEVCIIPTFFFSHFKNIKCFLRTKAVLNR